MKNANAFVVRMPVGTARDLRVTTVWPAPAPHAAAASVAGGIAEQRNRRTAAATDASVDGGFV